MLGLAGPQVPRPGAWLSAATMCFESDDRLAWPGHPLCVWQLGCLDTAGVGECGLLDQSPGAAPLW